MQLQEMQSLHSGKVSRVGLDGEVGALAGLPRAEEGEGEG